MFDGDGDIDVDMDIQELPTYLPTSLITQWYWRKKTYTCTVMSKAQAQVNVLGR